MVALEKSSSALGLATPALAEKSWPLQVLHLVPDSQPNGLASPASNLARATRIAGGQAFWAAPEGLLSSYLPRDGVATLRLPALPYSFFATQNALRRLRPFVKEHDIRLVHAHGGAMALLGARLAKRAGLGFVASSYTPLAELPKAQANALLSAQHLFPYSETLRLEAVEYAQDLREHSSIAGPSVDLSRFTPGVMKPLILARFCQELHIAEDTSVVFFPLSQRNSRTLKLYLQALQTLQLPNLVTLFVMPPETSAQDHANLEERLVSEGLGTRARVLPARGDLRLYYQLADLLVSDREDPGFDQSVAEAQAFGKPVLAAMRETILDQVEHGKTGWIYMPSSPLTFTAALRLILSLSEPRRRDYALDCQQALIKGYDLGAVWQTVFAGYESVMDQGEPYEG